MTLYFSKRASLKRKTQSWLCCRSVTHDEADVKISQHEWDFCCEVCDPDERMKSPVLTKTFIRINKGHDLIHSLDSWESFQPFWLDFSESCSWFYLWFCQTAADSLADHVIIVSVAWIAICFNLSVKIIWMETAKNSITESTNTPSWWTFSKGIQVNLVSNTMHTAAAEAVYISATSDQTKAMESSHQLVVLKQKAHCG